MILLCSRTSGVQSFFQLIGVLLIFVFVLAITYYVTKWIAGYQKQHNFQKNMRVVETMKLTTNKYIQIIEVGETYLVIGIGKDEVTMLAQLTREQLNDVSLEDTVKYQNTGESFSNIMKQFKEHLLKSRHKDE